MLDKSNVSTTRPIIAWDIETCPLPDEMLTDVHRERIDKEVSTLLQHQPDLDEDATRRLAMSTHLCLGWICCISAVAGTLDGGHRDPISLTASSIDEEKALLEAFWDKVGRFPGSPLWVTFNGKRFDVPFVLARSAHYGVTPSRFDLANTYPYTHTPHADLYSAWPCCYTLEDMCTLLNVTSSKDGFDGSMVANAVASGRIEDVARYCEADVVATWDCYLQVYPFLS